MKKMLQKLLTGKHELKERKMLQQNKFLLLQLMLY